MTRRKSSIKIAAQNDLLIAQRLFAKLSPAGQRRFFEMQLAEDFPAFVMKVFETVSSGDVFLSNWHIDAMSYAAEKVMDGEITRLIVTVPPRHLKSIIFSVALPAFLLGHDSTKRIACVSYSSELATKHANDFRAVLGSDWYRRIFPDTRISRDKDTQSETMTTKRGYRLATSIGGTLMGRGADLIVMDDPQKPEEALSETARKSAADWFDSTLLSRLDSKSEGAIILVMQRLHQEDLAGRLLEKGGWDHLKIPAIAEQDERIRVGYRRTYLRNAGTVIDPRRESKEVLLNTVKQSMGALLFSAQYQQEPIPLEGNLIKRDWFKEYDVAPIFNDTDKLVISIDTALKGDPSADFSVATVWLTRGDHSYLIDLWRQRVEYPDLKRSILWLRAKYPQASLLIEDKGSGTTLIQELQRNNIGVIAVIPDVDKITRCAAVSAQFEAGCVLVPKSAPWLDDLKAELLGFPNAKYDDQVDSVSQALNWIAQNRQNEVRWVAPIIVTRPRRYFGDPPDSWWLGP